MSQNILYQNKNYTSYKELWKENNKGVRYRTFMLRIRNGLSLDDALKPTTRKRENKNYKKKCKDHLKKEHESIEAMCKFWNVEIGTYYNRLSVGYTLEEALTGIRKKVKDHLGNSFQNVQEMCDYWKISKKAYNRKKESGYTLEEALTSHLEFKCIDFFGIHHRTVTDMCKYWNVKVYNYYAILRRTSRISLALNIIPGIHAKGRPHKCFFFRDNFYINEQEYIGVDNKKYWSCIIDNKKIILSEEEIYQRMEEIVIEEYKSTGTVQTTKG